MKFIRQIHLWLFLLASTVSLVACSGYGDVDYTGGWEYYVSSHESMGNYIARSDDYIFYIDNPFNGDSIVRMRVKGSDKQTILCGWQVSALALYDEGILFVSELDKHIYRANADGTDVKLLSDNPTDSFFVYGDDLYYIDGYRYFDDYIGDYSNAGTQNLYRMNLKSGDVDRITTFRTSRIQLLDDAIYCYDEDLGYIIKIDCDTMEKTVVYMDAAREIMEFEVHGDDLYYSYNNGFDFFVDEDEIVYEYDVYNIDCLSMKTGASGFFGCEAVSSPKFTVWDVYHDTPAVLCHNSFNRMKVVQRTNQTWYSFAEVNMISPIAFDGCIYYCARSDEYEGIVEFDYLSGTYTNLQPPEDVQEKVPEVTMAEEDLYYTGYESFYTFQDPSSWLWGIYDMSSGEITMEATMEEIGAFDDQGIAPARNGEYWGYINCFGGTEIGFFFDKADTFIGNYATVYCNGSGAGVIDRSGFYIIEPKYTFVYLKDSFILAQDSSYGNPFNLVGILHAYNYNGQLIISTSDDGHSYNEIKEYNGFLYAKPRGEDKYELYDLEGNRITGRGDWSEIRYVSYPKNGMHILYCEEMTSLGYYKSIGMRIADEQFNIINDQYYNSLSSFNKHGYAVAENQSLRWHIINKAGEVVRQLPVHEIYDVEVDYIYANDYMAYCGAQVGATGTYYGVVDFETNELVRWGVVDPVDGSNCMIVTDEDTNLKGLYDGNTLVYACYYDEIFYENGVFTLSRGAETSVYSPTYQ